MNSDNSKNQNPMETIAALRAAEEAANQTADMEDVFQVIGNYLLRYGSDETIFCGSELDGFLAAIICAPEAIMPTTWVPMIWGGDHCVPEWEDEQERSQFGGAMYVYHNIVTKRFENQSYEPLFLENSNPGTDLSIVEEWSEGFLRGYSLWDEISAEDMEQLEHCLYPIRCFGTSEGTVALESMSETEIQQLQVSIAPKLQVLYKHFDKQVKAASTPFVHGEPKVGRNELCPCGSGKKYKKCCGLN